MPTQTTETTTTINRPHKHFSLTSTMDSPADKEERKREYNRVAQREFRRRRKEHLKNLEQAQKEQNSEQSEEIERLRYENDELRRENDSLKTHIYGSSSSSSGHGHGHSLLPTPHNISSMGNDRNAYSLSPSISTTSMSRAGSPPASLGPELMGLSITSPMLPPNMTSYSDPSGLSDQPYSMVLSSGIHHNAHSSPESSGYAATSRAPMGSSFPSLSHGAPVPRGSAPQESSSAYPPGDWRRQRGGPQLPDW